MVKDFYFIPLTVNESGVWLLATQKPKKEARLVERKVCFISDASNKAGRADSCLKANLTQPLTISGQELLCMEGGATCRNSTVSSDSHLESGHVVV